MFGDAHEDYYDLGTSFSDYFYGCKKMDLSAFDTSKCTNMGEMFRGCKELTDVDVTSFDTRRVKDMWLMFFDCKDLKDVDLSSFSTMSVDDHIYWKRGVWDGYRDGLDSILSWSMFDGEWQIHTMDQIEHIKVSDEKLYNYLDEHNVYGECNLELVEGDSSKFEEVTKENISDRVAAYKDKLKKFERDFGLMDDDEPDLECDGSEMEM